MIDDLSETRKHIAAAILDGAPGDWATYQHELGSYRALDGAIRAIDDLWEAFRKKDEE